MVSSSSGVLVGAPAEVNIFAALYARKTHLLQH